MQKTYYFDNYDVQSQAFEVNPQNACDDNIATYAESTVGDNYRPSRRQILNSNTSLGVDLGSISKVEIRAYIGVDSNCTLHLAGLLYIDGNTIFSEDFLFTNVGPAWIDWQDITAMSTWDWTKIKNLQCVLLNGYMTEKPWGTARVYAVELKVTVVDPTGPMPMFIK